MTTIKGLPSTILCPHIPANYSAAAKKKEFFTIDEISNTLTPMEKREMPDFSCPKDSCKTNLFFGFFFDGTKNNYMKSEVAKNHSNVARLYDCFPGLSVPSVLDAKLDWVDKEKKFEHFFRVYIPGVSSPFSLVGDTGEGMDDTAGGAIGAYGDRRIVWAMLQAINNVHRFFKKGEILVKPAEALSIARRLTLNKDYRKVFKPRTSLFDENVDEDDKRRDTQKAFEGILKRLHSAIEAHMPVREGILWGKADPGRVKTIHISTFGFSRGATQARAFQNWIMTLCELDSRLTRSTAPMSLGGFPVKFDFLGLYDTVASVGVGNSLGGIPGLDFNGHGGYADTDDSLRIPEGVFCVHLVAAHELRRSFPLDSISVRGKLPPNCWEIVIPGVHSDLGSGYAPLEQGKGTDASGADMLARIPLVMMYRMARLAGVPLKLELATKVAQSRFAVSPATIAVLNEYLALCKQKSGTLTAIMREQARHQMEWRLSRRPTGPTPIQEASFYRRATVFDQNDFYSANLEFEQEIRDFEAWKSKQGKKFVPELQDPGFDNDRDDEWEEIATWYKPYPTPAPSVMALFDDFVHDSRAWFKLIPGNPDSEQKMHEDLAKWVKRRDDAAAINAVRAKQRAETPSMHASRNPAHHPVSHGLSATQLKLADEYAKMPKDKKTIPRMITEGREPYKWNGAGYLRYRKIYGGFDWVLLSDASGVHVRKALSDVSPTVAPTTSA